MQTNVVTWHMTYVRPFTYKNVSWNRYYLLSFLKIFSFLIPNFKTTRSEQIALCCKIYPTQLIICFNSFSLLQFTWQKSDLETNSSDFDQLFLHSFEWILAGLRMLWLWWHLSNGNNLIKTLWCEHNLKVKLIINWELLFIILPLGISK